MGREPALHGECGMSAHEIRDTRGCLLTHPGQTGDGWPKKHRYPSALCFPFCKVKAISPPLHTSQGYCKKPASRTFQNIPKMLSFTLGEKRDNEGIWADKTSDLTRVLTGCSGFHVWDKWLSERTASVIQVSNGSWAGGDICGYISFYFWLCHAACRVIVPPTKDWTCSPAMKHRVLTPEEQERSLFGCILKWCQ